MSYSRRITQGDQRGSRIGDRYENASDKCFVKKQICKGAITLLANYCEKIIRKKAVESSKFRKIQVWPQVGKIFAKKFIDKGGMSGKDFIDASLDCFGLQARRGLNNYASDTFLKCASKTTAVKNNASNLAKENFATGVISFGVWTVIDVLKGKDVIKAIKENAASATASAVGGFLGGLFGQAFPIIGPSVGSEIGSALGSWFSS